MAQLVFVPDWLAAELSASGKDLESFRNDFVSSIVSGVDVINYHKSQWQFMKLLLADQYSSDEMYSMYQSMFVHQLPDTDEVNVFLKQDERNVIIWDDMAAATGTQDRLRFHIELSLDGNVIYIIGENIDQGQSRETVCAEPYAIVCNMLKVKHKGIRVSGSATDKSSVFRESPLLTQLYVKMNKSNC